MRALECESHSEGAAQREGFEQGLDYLQRSLNASNGEYRKCNNLYGEYQDERSSNNTWRSTSTRSRKTIDLRDPGNTVLSSGVQRSQTESRRRNCETEVGNSKFQVISGMNRLINDSNFQRNTEFMKQITELTKKRTRLREEVVEVRRGAQSVNTSTESEKQKKINSLDLIVSLNVTKKTKDKMTQKFKMDLNWSESREAYICSKFGIIKTPSSVSMKLLILKTKTAQAVLPRVTRHLFRRREIQSQGKRLQAAIKTRLLAAIIGLKQPHCDVCTV